MMSCEDSHQQSKDSAAADARSKVHSWRICWGGRSNKRFAVDKVRALATRDRIKSIHERHIVAASENASEAQITFAE